MNRNDIPAVAIQVSRDIVVASIKVDLADDVLARFRDDLLRRVDQTDSSGVILDLSGLETIDSHEFAALRQIIAAVEIMGAQAVLAGLQPGVVSSLIEAGADVDGLNAAISMDAAFALLQPVLESQPDLVPEPESDQEGPSHDDPQASWELR